MYLNIYTVTHEWLVQIIMRRQLLKKVVYCHNNIICPFFLYRNWYFPIFSIKVGKLLFFVLN